MLSTQEEKFIVYWEKNRLRRKKTMRQFLLGIPAGLLIVVPIVISFTSGWYRRANMEANNQDFNPMVLFVALLLIVGFTAIFYQKHQWDQLEQRYRELVARKARVGAAEPGAGIADAAQAGDAARTGEAADAAKTAQGAGAAQAKGTPQTGAFTDESTGGVDEPPASGAE